MQWGFCGGHFGSEKTDFTVASFALKVKQLLELVTCSSLHEMTRV